MSKIKDFFKYIYKEFYNSDIVYLIATSVYLVISILITVINYPSKPLSLDAIFGVVAFWIGASVALLPILFILFGATAFFVDTIKSKLKR